MDAVKATYENGQNGIDTLNILLNAQRSLAQAESDYFRSVTNYAKSISQVHFRKGSLLEYNGVYLTEGPWPAKAYFDARRRARSRSAALYLDYGFTYPKVLSQGPNPQSSGKAMGAEEIPAGASSSPRPAGRPTFGHRSGGLCRRRSRCRRRAGRAAGARPPGFDGGRDAAPVAGRTTSVRSI